RRRHTRWPRDWSSDVCSSDLNGVSLFTRSWGVTTPTIAGSVEAILPVLPPTTPNTELAATVAQIGSSNGGTRIPAGGAVILARRSEERRVGKDGRAGGGGGGE